MTDVSHDSAAQSEKDGFQRVRDIVLTYAEPLMFYLLEIGDLGEYFQTRQRGRQVV